MIMTCAHAESITPVQCYTASLTDKWKLHTKPTWASAMHKVASQETRYTMNLLCTNRKAAAKSMNTR